MAGMEPDVSSFALPVVPPTTAKQFGDMEQQKLQIDKQKLDLVTQHMAIANKELSILANDPNINQADVNNTLNRIAKVTNMPKEVMQKMRDEYASAGNDPVKLKHMVDLNLRRGMSVAEQLANQYGTPSTVNNNQQITPVQISQQKGTIAPMNVAPQLKPAMQMQPGPDLPVATPGGQQALGPQRARLPEAAPAALPVRPIADRNAAAAAANPAAFEQQNGYKPSGPMTSQPPMFEEGKKQLAEDQALATQKLTAVKPPIQALTMMKDLRSGPGTETWNKAVAFLKANNIIRTEANDPTAIYQEVNKYLSQYVQGSGTRSDADLASREASSPNVGTQINPALVKLTRNAIALDRVQAARAAAFEDSDYSKYGNHRSTFPAQIDERAFGIDLMEPKERQALMQDMKKKKDTAEGKKFWKSLSIADKQGLLNQ